MWIIFSLCKGARNSIFFSPKMLNISLTINGKYHNIKCNSKKLFILNEMGKNDEFSENTFG